MYGFSLISFLPIQASNKAYIFIALNMDNFIGKTSDNGFILCSVNAQHTEETVQS